jgi:hypothetical protein
MNVHSVLSELHGETEIYLLRRIRRRIVLFIVLLVLSGITAFPVQTELHVLLRFQHAFPGFIRWWLIDISAAVDSVAAHSPYLLYAYDWLAFAHLVIAMFFYGVYKNPVQNRWVLRVGMIACGGVFVLAFTCGQVRGIPVFWTMIDCSFGFFGMIPLLLVDGWVKRLELLQTEKH